VQIYESRFAAFVFHAEMRLTTQEQVLKGADWFCFLSKKALRESTNPGVERIDKRIESGSIVPQGVCASVRGHRSRGTVQLLQDLIELLAMRLAVVDHGFSERQIISVGVQFAFLNFAKLGLPASCRSVDQFTQWIDVDRDWHLDTSKAVKPARDNFITPPSDPCQ
jgi:hypothetical protein